MCVWFTMNTDGSSVTLIFYRVGERWWKEPFLNIIAAAAQMSTLTHVEIAIGEEVGVNGMMKNVCRVFNDKAHPNPNPNPNPNLTIFDAQVGVELVERTGRNPQARVLNTRVRVRMRKRLCVRAQYVYQQLGCSKNSVHKMLHYAKTCCVGKPFSNMGMARSLLWPRPTDSSSFLCAGAISKGIERAAVNTKCALPRRTRRRHPQGRWVDGQHVQPGQRDARDALPHLQGSGRGDCEPLRASRYAERVWVELCNNRWNERSRRALRAGGRARVAFAAKGDHGPDADAAPCSAYHWGAKTNRLTAARPLQGDHALWRDPVSTDASNAQFSE